MSDPRDAAKEAAARHAATVHVDEGMIVGLGSGSTALLFVEALAARIAAGLTIRGGIPTSSATEAAARERGVPLVTFEEALAARGPGPAGKDGAAAAIDVTVDGADEVDASLRLMKGGGACLLREKIVARASARMVVIADQTKRVERLGAFPLPVEVVPFGAVATRAAIVATLERLLGRPVPVERRLAGGAPLTTDGGNVLFDCRTGPLDDPAAVAAGLSGLPGVVEHGLFLSEADVVVLGHGSGAVETFERRP